MQRLHFFQRHRPRSSALRMRGFSLIEVMVTVGILGVLAALAGPSFQPLIDKWRMTQAIENMKSTMYYARAEAVKRGGRIGIQKNDVADCAPVSTARNGIAAGLFLWTAKVRVTANGTKTKKKFCKTFHLPSTSTSYTRVAVQISMSIATER